MNEQTQSEIEEMLKNADGSNEDYPESFFFEEPGDMIVGILRGVEEGVGTYEKTVYSIEKPDGELVTVWSSTVLEKAMKKVDVGDSVGIKYHGKVRGENATYKNFSVVKVGA